MSELLTPTDLYDYQKRAIRFQLGISESALWLAMGLGKTVVTLTSISHLLGTGFLKGVLIIAPVRVCRLVWRQEALKWAHTNHLTFSMVIGTPDQRIRALRRKADVYLINHENMEWLYETLRKFIKRKMPLPFDGIVFDELSKLKNSTTVRVKSFMKMRVAFKWFTGLTGTPASNGYKDLHGQYMVLDGGKRLGTTKKYFEEQFLRDDGPFKKVEKYDTPERIKALIGDMTIYMKASDYIKMPDLIVNDVHVTLPSDVRGMYDEMENNYFMQLDNGEAVEVFNAASMTNKCLQIANGGVYPISGLPMWERVHDEKLNALEDIIEEAAGNPVLCSYSYRLDAERIMEKFKKLRPINLTTCKSESSLMNAMHRWQTGDCALMIGHPASMGHGIDGLQKTGNILVWFGLNWSLDLYDQFNARIERHGQERPVICHRILCEDTLDMAQAEALDMKAVTQNGLRKAIESYRRGK